MFPGADFSGFWICHRKQNSASNDTTYVKVSICSGSNPLTPTLIGKGQWKLPVSRNNHTLTVLLYRYNTFMPVYLHLLSFYEHVNFQCDPAL